MTHLDHLSEFDQDIIQDLVDQNGNILSAKLQDMSLTDAPIAKTADEEIVMVATSGFYSKAVKLESYRSKRVDIDLDLEGVPTMTEKEILRLTS